MRGIIVVLLVSFSCGDAFLSHNSADQLVECFDRLHKVSHSTTGSEALKLFNQCFDALDYYSNTKNQRSNEIVSIIEAAYHNLQKNLIGEAKRYIAKFAQRLFLDYLDDDTKDTVLHGLKKLGRAYELFYTVTNGKAEIKLIQHTVERITVTSLLFNPTTTKATKWAATLKKYSNHVGIAADVAEYGLGMMGYERGGKTVGAVGNTVSGAMTGFAIGGPPGAALGAVCGFLLWWK